jgi:hypothetical protein
MPATNLVIMNGPHDGTVHTLERRSCMISAGSDADIRLTCDPDLPNAGIALSISDDGAVYEDKGSGTTQKVAFGVLHAVGQTLLAVHRDAGSTPDAPETTTEAPKGEAM